MASSAGIRKVFVRLPSESSEPAILLSQTSPSGHLPVPPPTRWPAFFTLPILPKDHVVWRRLCDVVLFPYCLVEHTLMAVCVLPHNVSVCRKYKVHYL